MSLKVILPKEVVADVQLHLPSNLTVLPVDNEGNIDGDAKDAEVYFNWFYLKKETLHKVLTSAPALRWQHTPSAGVNHILTPTFLERDIILTNGAGVHAIPIAEFVITYMLAYAKQLPSLYTCQAEKHWKKGWPIKELKDATLLIIGAGGIGQEIALRAKAFGMQIFGSRRHPQAMPNFDLVVDAQECRSLLPKSDYVVIAAPLTPETKGMIDAKALSLMRPNAYLINIARGAVVDDIALYKALSEGAIAGAALDTFYTEPLPPESPFWSLPNVFVTPHCSGNSPKVIERSLALFLDNFNRYSSRKPLRNVVNKKVGY